MAAQPGRSRLIGIAAGVAAFVVFIGLPFVTWLAGVWVDYAWFSDMGQQQGLHHAHHLTARRRDGVRAAGVRDPLHEHARCAADGPARGADRPAGGHARAAADVHRADPRQHGPDPGQGDTVRLARPGVPQRRRDVDPLADVPPGACLPSRFRTTIHSSVETSASSCSSFPPTTCCATGFSGS